VIDFTTTSGATLVRPTRIHAERCAQCHLEIIGGRKRQYCTPSCRRQARVDRERTRERSPEWIAQRREWQRAYRQTVTGRRGVLVTKRKGRLDGTQGYLTRKVYLASMKRRNRKRAKRNRAWAHLNQTKYAGTDASPTCANCGAEISYTGRGRPRKFCSTHSGRWKDRKRGRA
jgi:hypothetical protein